MTNSLTTAVIATTLAAGLGGAANADILQPMQGGTYSLNEWTASVHYTDDGGSYGVVITLAALQGDRRVPIRFAAALEPGQSKAVEIGSFDKSEEPAVLKIRRIDDGLSVSVPPPEAVSASGSQ